MTLAFKIETVDSQNKFKIIFCIYCDFGKRDDVNFFFNCSLYIQLRDNLNYNVFEKFRNLERLENQKCIWNDNDILMDSMNYVNDAFEGRKYT